MRQLDNKMLESIVGGRGRRGSTGNVTRLSTRTNYSKVVASGNYISRGGDMSIIVTQNIGDNDFNTLPEEQCCPG